MHLPDRRNPATLARASGNAAGAPLQRPLAAILTVALLITTLWGASPPGDAARAATSSRHLVSMFSERPDEPIGQGQTRLFHGGNSTVSISGTAQRFTVVVDTAAQPRALAAVFHAPAGTKLRPGFYPDAQWADSALPGHPGIDVSHGGACNSFALTGSFDIKQLYVRADGTVSGVWLTYRQSCDIRLGALFGEVRVGLDNQSVSAAMPRVTQWPTVDAGTPAVQVPVALLAPATSSERVTSVELGGWDADDFEIRDDRCTGVVVRAREDCRVWVRFSPQSGGPKFGQLIFNLASGERRVADLEGQAVAQTTEVHLESDPGDYIGQGQTYDYDESTASFIGGGHRNNVTLDLFTDDVSDYWSTRFHPPASDILAEGRTYLNARRAGFGGEFPGLELAGQGRGCNALIGWFTVEDIGFTPDDEVSHFRISFELHCEWLDPAARGTVSWRVPPEDRVPPGPVSNLRVLRTGRQVDLTWTNPADDDVASIIVRRLAGTRAPALPTTGVPVSVGLGAATSVQGPNTMIFGVWAVDEAGNVGPRRTISVAAE